MPNRDVLTIGTSAGGVEALIYLARKLPAGFQASVFVTIHLSSDFPSSLDSLLSQAGALPAAFAIDGETVRRGRIYIAPPAHHLILDDDRIVLGSGPRENSARPAVDPMMRSAGVCCGGRAIGVVLTGAMGDGASGLWALKECGGIAVVQDPEDAAFPEMPTAALRRANADWIAPLKDLPALVAGLVQEPAGEHPVVPDYIRYEVEIAKNGHSSMNGMDRIAGRSVLTCPDCHGIMWQIEEGGVPRYRCHLGHAYTEEMMTLALDESLRRSLASGLRALEERATLVRGMRDRASVRGHTGLAYSWAEKLREFEREAAAVRESLRRIDALARLARHKDHQRERAAE
jgi:two-component system chemotaxis response regulator CheB